jgi:hypothetical protein
MAQLLRHTPTNLMAEYFHLSEAHVFDSEVSVIDPLLYEFFRKPIDNMIRGDWNFPEPGDGHP